jgi:hypothetical protein
MREKEKGMERGERERERGEEKDNRGNTRISEVLLPLPPRAMAEQDWAPSTVTPGHLQNVVKKGFMIAA